MFVLFKRSNRSTYFVNTCGGHQPFWGLLGVIVTDMLIDRQIKLLLPINCWVNWKLRVVGGGEIPPVGSISAAQSQSRAEQGLAALLPKQITFMH